MSTPVIILIVVLVVILIIYNKLVKLRNKVKQSESGIDIYLNQRFDLIPNLVECVKGYAKYEKEVYESIVKARNEYKQNKKVDFKQANEINRKLNGLMAVAERYPDLKASEQFTTLEKSLVKMESQLQAARRIYNNDVTIYNTKLETVPINFFAKILGFKKAELLEIEEYKRENIDIESEL